MPTKAGRSRFLDAIKRRGIETITDDFRGKLRPSPGDTFNGTAYRILDEDMEVMPPLDMAMTADDILRFDSLYGTFELIDRGYMGMIKGSNIEEGGTYMLEVTDIEEFQCRPFHHVLRARPLSKLASRPKSVAYVKAPAEEEGEPESQAQAATEPPSEEPDEIVHTGKYGLSGSETLMVYGNVKGMWEQCKMGDEGSYPALRDDKRTFNPKRGVRPGDVFSAILMAYTKREKKQGNYRIFQFANQGYMGYVSIFDPGLYKVNPLPFGELHSGWVYRFEAFRTSMKGQIFYCKAFKTLLGEDAVSVNFVKGKYADLPGREPFEFILEREYLVGINHMAENENGRFGVFYDALHPDKTGIVHFGSPGAAEWVKFGGWAYVRVSHAAPGKKGRTTVHSDFIEFA